MQLRRLIIIFVVFPVVIQVGVTRASSNLLEKMYPNASTTTTTSSTTTEPRHECVEGQCGDDQICVEGICQCKYEDHFFPAKSRNCYPHFYKGPQVRLLYSPLPVVKGDQVKILCQITLTNQSESDDFEITWYFNSRKINTNNSAIFNSTVGTFHQMGTYVHSNLTIYRFRNSLTGTYTCKMRQKVERNIITVGNVSISKDMFVVPEIQLEPPYLYVRKYTSVTVHCHARQINYIEFNVDGFSSEVEEVYRSHDKFITRSFSFTPQAKSRVQCIGQLERQEGMVKVTSNEVVIHLLSEGNITCPESEDRRGISWTIAEGPSVVRGDCPKDNNGYSTRECSSKGKWKKTNFTNCLRKDLEEIGQEVETLEEIDPSEETIANITSKLSKSISGPESLLLSDVSQTIDILANVSNTLSKDESDRSLMSTTSLENLVDVTDQLLSTDQNEWENIDQPDETVTETRKPNRLGAKLLMAMDSLVVASLKESKISSRPIIKRNIVVKRNQAEHNNDVYFPDKSDTIIKELGDWMNGSDNSVFLSSAALPANIEKIRYSVLLYKGMRQRMSSRVKDLRDKDVRSNIMAFSLNKKIKQLTPGIELTFRVPTDKFSEPACGFLDTSASELGIWSTEGCKTQQLKSGIVKCTCNHLTNFAVLLSPSRIQNSTHEEVLGIITICGCTISIISLLALIIIYAILWKHMKKDRKTYLHLALSISLLLVYVIFLAGVERPSYEPDCIITAGVLHYFLLTVFCLMLCEGVELLMAVLYVFPSNFPVWRLLLPAFGAPLFIVAITLAITQANDYRSDDICWLSLSSGTLWAFVAPALVVILVNFIVMCITLRIVLGSTAVKGEDNLAKTKMALKSIVVLSPVLGLTWLFGILSINSYTIVFQYLFALCNTLQGFAIFFFYCLSFYQVKDAFKVISKSGQSESETQSSSNSRVRNVFRKKQKGSYAVEKAAFLNTQPKSLSEKTNQKEPATIYTYEVNPGEDSNPWTDFISDISGEPSTVVEQESVFMESDVLNDKNAGERF